MKKQLRGPLPVYVHVKKTGGNSVRDLLFANYSPLVPKEGEFLDGLLPSRTDSSGLPFTPGSTDAEVQQFIELLQALEDRLLYVASDLPYGIHRYLKRRVSYFTILREPIDRCRSLWFFSFGQGNRTWARLRHFDYDVAAAVEAGEALGFSNDQTRMISGTNDKTITRFHLETAKRRIEKHFVYVGMTDTLDADLKVLSSYFGWTTTQVAAQNIGSYSDGCPTPADLREALAGINAFDIELVDWFRSHRSELDLPRLQPTIEGSG